ncbi:MAG: DUF4097 family beta strand repeat-containing protein [Acidobacteriota bacterium]
MLLTFVFAFLSLFPSASTDEWKKSFTIENIPKLRVESGDANIRVLASESKTVDVRVISDGYKIGDDGIKIIDRQNGDNVEIEVRFPRRWFQMNWRSKRVDIEINVPRETNLDLNTGDGRIDLSGVKGEILLRSGDGKINLTDVHGRLSAKTGDGNIEMRNVKGEISMSTGDGRIEATGLEGAFRAETGDGRLRIQGRFDALDIRTGDGGIEATALDGSKTESNWSLKTGDGDITLRLPETLSADVEMHTNDGHIDLNIPVSVVGRTGNNEIRGRINSGGKMLYLKTGDGSIRLEKL